MNKRERMTRYLLRPKENKCINAVWNAFASVQENPFPVQVLSTLAYRLLLDLLYVTLISPIYGYSGFTTTILPLRYLPSLLAAAVFAPVVVYVLNDRSPSSILISFINYLYFIPLTSYCGCKGSDGAFFAVSLLYWGILLLLQCRIPKLVLKPLPEKGLRIGALLLTIFCVCFVLTISGVYTGFRLTLDFINVYGIRAEAAGYEMPTLASYLLGMMPIAMAVLLLYWLQRKKILMLVLMVGSYLFLFSIAAHKSVFFFLFLVLCACIFYRDWMLRWIPGLLLLTGGLAVLEHLGGGIYFLSYFFRRMMYIPVRISSVCAAFVSESPLGLFQGGIMGKLSFGDLYSQSMACVIGEFMGEYGTNANNGLLGDLFVNLPVLLGVLLMPLILVICFRLLDLTAGTLQRRVVVSFCVYYAISFINSSWSTVLLSHGFLMACLLLYFFPKEDYAAI